MWTTPFETLGSSKIPQWDFLTDFLTKLNGWGTRTSRSAGAGKMGDEGTCSLWKCGKHIIQKPWKKPFDWRNPTPFSIFFDWMILYSALQNSSGFANLCQSSFSFGSLRLSLSKWQSQSGEYNSVNKALSTCTRLAPEVFHICSDAVEAGILRIPALVTFLPADLSPANAQRRFHIMMSTHYVKLCCTLYITSIPFRHKIRVALWVVSFDTPSHVSRFLLTPVQSFQCQRLS